MGLWEGRWSNLRLPDAIQKLQPLWAASESLLGSEHTELLLAFTECLAFVYIGFVYEHSRIGIGSGELCRLPLSFGVSELGCFAGVILSQPFHDRTLRLFFTRKDITKGI